MIQSSMNPSVFLGTLPSLVSSFAPDVDYTPQWPAFDDEGESVLSTSSRTAFSRKRELTLLNATVNALEASPWAGLTFR